MIQAFEIPGRLPGANEYIGECRKNARAGGKLKKEATERVVVAARHLVPMQKGVQVSITWIESNMRRDRDNIRFGAKFVLDGLVQAGIIENDGWTWIEGISDTYRVNKTNPRVIVELEGETRGAE